MSEKLATVQVALVDRLQNKLRSLRVPSLCGEVPSLTTVDVFRRAGFIASNGGTVIQSTTSSSDA